MPRAAWPLLHSKPRVQVVLTFPLGGKTTVRELLADTGAGTADSAFQLVLDIQDCLLFGAPPSMSVVLGAAYQGTFPIHFVRVRIPALSFDHDVPAVGVPTVPAGFDGIACFAFLNQFTFGNFGDPTQFGLEL